MVNNIFTNVAYVALRLVFLIWLCNLGNTWEIASNLCRICGISYIPADKKTQASSTV